MTTPVNSDRRRAKWPADVPVSGRLEEILAFGNAGETIGEKAGELLGYNGVLILALRYLLEGPDTAEVKAMDIGWAEWPTRETHSGPLPQDFGLMPKGLLLNYFEWREKEKP